MSSSPETNHPILVTGATGRHGATGPILVRLLRDRGFAVRAMVRSIDERSAALEAGGAEVVAADYLDIESLKKALHGVKRAYFCYPVAAGIVDAAARFAAAGRESG